MADLSQIQNRSGDRKAAVEMVFDASPGDRAEVKELFRQLQRARSKAAEPERLVELCRQAAQTLEPGRARTQDADLQEHAMRNAQEAARTREATSGEDDPTEARKRRQGRSLSHGMGL